MMLDAALSQALLGAGMHRKNDWYFVSKGIDGAEKLG